jgi:hypothetical protein
LRRQYAKLEMQSTAFHWRVHRRESNADSLDFLALKLKGCSSIKAMGYATRSSLNESQKANALFGAGLCHRADHWVFTDTK